MPHYSLLIIIIIIIITFDLRTPLLLPFWFSSDAHQLWEDTYMLEWEGERAIAIYGAIECAFIISLLFSSASSCWFGLLYFRAPILVNDFPMMTPIVRIWNNTIFIFYLFLIFMEKETKWERVCAYLIESEKNTKRRKSLYAKPRVEENKLGKT